MQSPQGDIEALTAFFAAIAAGDPGQALALTDPDVVWRPTVWSGGGTLHGHAAIARWFSQFGPNFEHLRIDLHHLLPAEREAVVLAVVHDTRDSGSMSTRVGWTFKLEDGLIVDGRAYGSWDEALTTAGLR